MSRNQIAPAPMIKPHAATIATPRSRKQGVRSNLNLLKGPHPSKLPQKGSNLGDCNADFRVDDPGAESPRIAWELPSSIFEPRLQNPYPFQPTRRKEKGVIKSPRVLSRK